MREYRCTPEGKDSPKLTVTAHDPEIAAAEYCDICANKCANKDFNTAPLSEDNDSIIVVVEEVGTGKTYRVDVLCKLEPSFYGSFAEDDQ